MTDSAILLASFQLTNYAGVYIDEIIAKKQMIKAIGVFYPTYYPALVAEKKIKEPVMDS